MQFPLWPEAQTDIIPFGPVSLACLVSLTNVRYNAQLNGVPTVCSNEWIT